MDTSHAEDRRKLRSRGAVVKEEREIIGVVAPGLRVRETRSPDRRAPVRYLVVSNFSEFFPLDDALPLREQAACSIDLLEAWHAMIVRHWAGGAPGWAPPVATAVLSRSRLDRQASLCTCLRLWLDVPAAQSDGHLILAWVNLGSLVEGTLKLFLSVFAADYSRTPKLDRKGKPRDPDTLGFDELRQFFKTTVWNPEQAPWDAWLQCVQRRRNAIHAYKHTEIGAHDDFLSAVVGYRHLTQELDGQIPWWSGDR